MRLALVISQDGFPATKLWACPKMPGPNGAKFMLMETVTVSVKRCSMYAATESKAARAAGGTLVQLNTISMP